MRNGFRQDVKLLFEVDRLRDVGGEGFPSVAAFQAGGFAAVRQDWYYSLAATLSAFADPKWPMGRSVTSPVQVKRQLNVTKTRD